MIFGISIMVFDNPAAEKQFLPHLLYWSMRVYPLLIVIAIFLAYKFNSVFFALLATIPLLFIIFTFATGDTIAKEEFKNRSRDFTCGPDKFISITSVGDFTHADFYEKKFISSYSSSFIGTINKVDMTIKVRKGKDFSFISACKDKDGKSFTEVYTLVPAGNYQESSTGAVKKLDRVDRDETNATRN